MSAVYSSLPEASRPKIVENKKTGWFSIEHGRCALSVSDSTTMDHEWVHPIEASRSYWQTSALAQVALDALLALPIRHPEVNFDL